MTKAESGSGESGSGKSECGLRQAQASKVGIKVFCQFYKNRTERSELNRELRILDILAS